MRRSPHFFCAILAALACASCGDSGPLKQSSVGGSALSQGVEHEPNAGQRAKGELPPLSTEARGLRGNILSICSLELQTLQDVVDVQNASPVGSSTSKANWFCDRARQVETSGSWSQVDLGGGTSASFRRVGGA